MVDTVDQQGPLMGNTAVLNLLQGDAAPAAQAAAGPPGLGGAGDDGQPGEDGELGAGGMAQAAPGGDPGAPLEGGIRSRAEGSLGMDLSGVRVHTDQQAADSAAGLQAMAFAQGQDIFFGEGQYDPGSQQGDELIAHELVHVAQQDGNGPALQAAGTISKSSDAAEVEAHAGAQAILSGSSFSPQEQSAGIARVENLAGNPAELTDNTGTATTTHRAPTINDAVNRPAVDAVTNQAHVSNVRVVAEEGSKLHLEPPQTPLPERVYEESEEQVSPPPVGFTTVTDMRGTVGMPQVTQEANNSIYINGTPTGDDVQQAGIGDCYFLATLLSVLSRDPGKVPAMMASDGSGGATVTFWRRQDHEATFWERITGTAPDHDYIQVAVSVNSELAVDISDNQVRGAQLRCGDLPKAVDYWAKITGSTLEVHRDDEFECARWAPLMEKAYARFAQQHGQYGGAHGDSGVAAGESGYTEIDGGVPMYTMSIFYGEQADQSEADVQREDITWAPGADILAANPRVVDQLLLLAGRGDSAGASETDAPIIVANAFVDDLIANLKAAIPAAQADADWANISAERQSDVAAILVLINTWEGMPADPPAPAPQPKAAMHSAIGVACAKAIAPGPPNPAGWQAIDGADPLWVEFEQEADQPKPTDAPQVTALGNALRAHAVPRVEVELEGHSSSEGTDAFNQDLSDRRASNVAAALAAGGALAPHTVTHRGVGETGAEATADWRRVDFAIVPDEANNNLHDQVRSEPLRALMDLMLDVSNMEDDTSTGQRNIYGGHAYQVINAAFVDLAGTTVPLQQFPSNLRPLLFPLVDVNQSTVRLRNPHHTNEPDRMGDDTPTRPEDGAPDGPNADGVFGMSMNEFFRNFNAVDSGVFPRTTT